MKRVWLLTVWAKTESRPLVWHYQGANEWDFMTFLYAKLNDLREAEVYRYTVENISDENALMDAFRGFGE